MALVNGLNVEQMANQKNAIPGMVKNQLTNIFGKTGVNQLQDLIRLLLTGPYSVVGD